MVKVHAIQTGAVSVKAAQLKAKGTGPMAVVRTLLDSEWTEPQPIWVWAIEHPEGVILVDTGETSRTAEWGYFPRWHPYYRMAVRMHVNPEDEIGPKLKSLGIAPGDVRKVVLTHLHTDHAGGLHHFPQAEMLVARREFEAAQGMRGVLAGYLPHRWPDWFSPTLIEFPDGPVGAFPRSYRVTRAGDVHLVPTHGHAAGHMSVILQEGERSLFFAGDTSYTEALLLEGAVDGVSPDQSAARETVARIRRYAEEIPTVYLPSHDPDAARRLAERLVAVPWGTN